MRTKSAQNQDIFVFAKEKNCEFVDLKFTDLLGTWQHLTLTMAKFSKEIFRSGVGFDGSSVRGFQNIAYSDMVLMPDASTLFLDPVHKYPTISFICDTVDPIKRQHYSRDPRFVAQKAENYLKRSGIADVSYWGPELEFFVFNSIRFDTNDYESYYHINTQEGMWNSGDNTRDNRGYYIRNKKGYFAVPPNDQMLNLRSEIAEAMIKAGLAIDFHHHEVAAAGQVEFGMRHGTLVRQADNVLLSKYIAKNMCLSNGFTATFMPKPLFQDNGSAMHIHHSMWKDGTNVFYDAKGYARLSQLALYYIGGILHHTPALLAFCAPSTNSYRRLVPGYEAPVYLTYSQRNRSAAIRIPVIFNRPTETRIEYRCPDSTSNPYLAFAAVLMAGLDGIKKQIDPGKPVDDYLNRPPQKRKTKLKAVPHSLDAVLEALENDHDFLLEGGVFTPDLITTWLDYKRQYELEPLSLYPHPYEFHLYYDI